MNNLDIIEKLIRLANNNPNDNEANAAARKVCQMLKDHKFNGQSQPQSQPFNPSQKQQDWGFWDYDKGHDNKYRRDAQERQARKEAEAKRKVEEEFWKKFYERYTEPEFNPFSWNETPPKQSRGKQNLRCKDCGKTVETEFVGPPQMFQCISCWQDEMRQQGKWAKTGG